MSESFFSKKTANSRSILYCKECLMPNSRPRITFNEKGICNACIHSKNKFENIDWQQRQNEFLSILDKHRSKDGSWDCVVPWSGGKDSSAIAFKMKHEYGMNPLLVTFSPMIPNEVGAHNRELMIQAGFDSMFFRPNQAVHRKLAKRFFIERGNPKVAWDAGVNTIPVQVALSHNIKLIFYAEHGESEYGGKVLHEDSCKKRDFTEVIEHQIGDDPVNWQSEDISLNDLKPYLYPKKEDIEKSGLTAYYFAYFNKWSMFENYKYIKEKIDFRTEEGGRSCGTFTDFDSLDDKFDDIYYYLQYIKFGFGRCIRDVSRFIQNDHMTREEALDLCKKYDGEYPAKNEQAILDYMGIDKKTFIEVIDKHRNDEIWVNNGSWELRSPLK